MSFLFHLNISPIPPYSGSAADSCCKLYLDEKQQKQTTKLKKNTQSPVWNEVFVFDNIRLDQTLHLKIVNKSSLRSKFLGSTSFLLGNFLNPDNMGVTKLYARKFVPSHSPSPPPNEPSSYFRLFFDTNQFEEQGGQE